MADAGRDPGDLVTSLMTWMFLGRNDEEYLRRLERARSLDPTAGEFDAYRAEIEKDCIVGTPKRAVERIAAYADAGVQRIFLNHELYDDREMLELVGTELLPRIASMEARR